MTNLPNLLTLSRMGLTLLLVFLLLQPWPWAKAAALAVFVVAALTDLWDGRIARRRGLISKFGVLMDPIADKVLVLGSFAVFVKLGIMPVWMMALIAGREILITALRMAALSKGRALPAETAGKWKAALQMTTIAVTLLFLVARGLFAAGWWIVRVELVLEGLIFLTLLVTLASGLSFLWRNRKRIFG